MARARAHTPHTHPHTHPQVRRKDVLSVWSGIRPLASDPTRGGGGDGSDTQNIVREHVIFTDGDGLVTVSARTHA